MSDRRLKLRARERVLQRRAEDGIEQPTVEVLDGDEVLGWLPATSASYKLVPHQPGTLTVTVYVADANVEGH